jgi:hypothetical protein
MQVRANVPLGRSKLRHEVLHHLLWRLTHDSDGEHNATWLWMVTR